MKQYFIILLCLVISLGLIGVFYLYYQEDDEKIIINNNKYLTANYAMMIYSKVDEYVDKNIDLDNLEITEIIEVSDDQLVTNQDEYKDCDGTLKITKTLNDIYVYDIEASCLNVKDEVGLTLKVYSNTNQDSDYQVIHTLDKNELGYVGVLKNYKLNIEDNGWGLNSNSISGVVNLSNELDILNFKLFDSKKEGINTNLFPLKKGFILSEYKNINFDQVLTYYDQDYNSIWTNEIGNNYITDYLYETKEKIVFANFGEIIEFNKANGERTVTFKIEIPASSVHVSYNNGILYAYDWLHRDQVYKYDLNGNLLSSLDLSNYFSDNDETSIYANEKLTIYETLDNIYIFDNTGNILNQINKNDVLNYTNHSYFSIFEDGYSIALEGSSKNIRDMAYVYYKYDLNHELVSHKEYKMNYGYETLTKLGLNYEYDISYNTLINEKFFEILYTPDNNGTEVILMFE
ncbi:MAG: hypothetical protein IJ501_04905 [Bacilli bacterium]|nr:hypothetical protein [Bacilli bacterium]